MISKPRNILDIITQIKKYVPDDWENRDDLFHDLKSLQESVLYSAPEMMGFRWGQLGEILDEWLEKPDTEWKQKISDIINDVKNLDFKVGQFPDEPELTAQRTRYFDLHLEKSWNTINTRVDYIRKLPEKEHKLYHKLVNEHISQAIYLGFPTGFQCANSQCLIKKDHFPKTKWVREHFIQYGIIVV